MTSLAFFYFLKLMTLATLANGMTSSNKDLALSSCLLSPKAYHNKFEGQSATLHLMPSSSLIEEHTTNDGLNPEVKLIDFWKINESKKRTFDGCLDVDEQIKTDYKRKKQADYGQGWLSHVVGRESSQPLSPNLSLSLGRNPRLEERLNNFHPEKPVFNFKDEIKEFKQDDNYPLIPVLRDAQSTKNNQNNIQIYVTDKNFNSKKVKETVESSFQISPAHTSENISNLDKSKTKVFLAKSVQSEFNPVDQIMREHEEATDFPQNPVSSPYEYRYTLPKSNNESPGNEINLSTKYHDVASYRLTQQKEDISIGSKSNCLKQIHWIKKLRTPGIRKKRYFAKKINKVQTASHGFTAESSKELDILVRKRVGGVIEIPSKINGVLIQKWFRYYLESLKPKIDSIEKSQSSKNSLSVLAGEMDDFADSIQHAINPVDTEKDFIRSSLANSEENNILQKSLDHREIAIDETIFIDMMRKFKNTNYDGLGNSALSFIGKITKQIENSGVKAFYITNLDLKMFFKDKKIIFTVQWPFEVSNRNHVLYYEQISNMIVSSMDTITWKNTFIEDKASVKYDWRTSVITARSFPFWLKNYSSALKQRYDVRRLFLVYSTMINKIFCNGREELRESFHTWQEGAINSYDESWKFLQLKRSSNNRKDYYSILFIENSDLPLPNDIKEFFLNTYDIKGGGSPITQQFEVRADNHRRIQTEATWKFIALWLAKNRYDLYEKLYSPNFGLIKKVKPFITNLICCMAYK
ncbi:hypothetical protein BY996DRAFT_4037836 [Phakopsora pachyrhizi]|nr:hypothetical protein BY996DRAFT_4037836 [Phakopsora pachyrhizi]